MKKYFYQTNHNSRHLLHFYNQIFVYALCFCRFPLYNPRKLKKWLANVNLKDWSPSRFSVLCMDHFEEQYFDRTGKSVKLREDAVPTIFTSSDDTKKRQTKVF